jgi:hypothetical protein
VKAYVVLPIVLSPETLFLGEIKPGGKLEQTVTAWSPAGVPFRIISVDTAETGLQSTHSQDENGKVHIAFQGTANDPSKIIDKKIKVLVKLQGSNEVLSVELPVYASIKLD